MHSFTFSICAAVLAITTQATAQSGTVGVGHADIGSLGYGVGGLGHSGYGGNLGVEGIGSLGYGSGGLGNFGYGGINHFGHGGINKFGSLGYGGIGSLGYGGIGNAFGHGGLGFGVFPSTAIAANNDLNAINAVRSNGVNIANQNAKAFNFKNHDDVAHKQVTEFQRSKGVALSDKKLNANKLNFHDKNAIAKKNALSTKLLRSGISAW